ncbi:hypothetical protein [Cellulosimicrobium marinum]|uniref:hypothetical protein n=1 Tax=Cellulosimicrobium marinum TaxID=1638992 RepID=UPI001E57B81B|nr:hypothetical protein [Cellulosimicrobium marinum]MCB7137750.1 hypothetical protein [Cellulosimicrobium marinum]
MLTRAVVLPATPLLVPGAAGRADVLVATRQDVLAALRPLVGHDVVVLAAGSHGAGVVRGARRATLAAAGVADARLGDGWRPGPADAGQETSVAAGTGASVALLALAAAGVGRPADLVELGGAVPPGEARAVGDALRTGDAAVVVAADPRSAPLGHAVRALVDAAWSTDEVTSPHPDGGPPYAVVVHRAG